MRRSPRLFVASLALMFIGIAHDLDHLRQGRPVHADLAVVGFLGLAAAIAQFLFVLRGHRLAPYVAIVAGLGMSIGFFFVHVAPAWLGEFSDPYGRAHADALSWSIVLMQIAAGVVLAYAGATTPIRPPNEEHEFQRAT